MVTKLEYAKAKDALIEKYLPEMERLGRQVAQVDERGGMFGKVGVKVLRDAVAFAQSALNTVSIVDFFKRHATRRDNFRSAGVAIVDALLDLRSWLQGQDYDLDTQVKLMSEFIFGIYNYAGTANIIV